MFTDLDKFIKNEMELWGEDYIESLLNQGYTPILTNRGFKWILNSQRVDTEPDICYDGVAASRRTPVRSSR